MPSLEEGWQRLHTKVLPMHGPSVISANVVATLSAILKLKIVISFGKFREKGILNTNAGKRGW